MKTLFRIGAVVSVSALALFTGCAGGGYQGAYGGYNPYAATTSVLSSSVSKAVGGGVQGAVANALIQGMAASVMNGQIGSQVAPGDQNFRLQQLNGALQSGTVNQPQQWSNPQTGNTVALKPVGQQVTNPYNGQNCRDLEEIYTLKDGRTIHEPRRACQDQSGKWVLVQ